MKTSKFLSAVAILLCSAMTFISCNKKNEPSEQAEFTIKVSNVGSNSALLNITPNDNTKPYLWMTAPTMAIPGGDAKSAILYLLQEEGEEATYEEIVARGKIKTGKFEYFMDELGPDMEWIVAVCYINEHLYILSDEVTTYTFKTLPMEEE